MRLNHILIILKTKGSHIYLYIYTYNTSYLSMSTAGVNSATVLFSFVVIERSSSKGQLLPHKLNFFRFVEV